MSRKWRKARRGLGEGLAKVGELLFSAELQKMRDNRLAQIAEKAAAAREAGENTRLDKRIEADKAAAGVKYTRDKEVAQIGAAAKTAEKDVWKLETVKVPDGFGGTTEKEVYWNEGTKQQVDTSTPFGKMVKANADRGASISDSITAAQRALDADQKRRAAASATPSGDTHNSAAAGGGYVPGRGQQPGVLNRAAKPRDDTGLHSSVWAGLEEQLGRDPSAGL